MTENKTELLPCPLELTLDRLRDHKAKCQGSIDDHDLPECPQHLLDEYHETQKDIDAVKRVRDMGYFREWNTRATLTPSTVPIDIADDLAEALGECEWTFNGEQALARYSKFKQENGI